MDTEIEKSPPFISQFLVNPVHGAPPPKSHYDAQRQITVTEDGQPIVELTSGGETVTLTEVDREREDSDREDREPSTLTLVSSEGFDRAAEANAGSWADTGTFTKAMGEASDADDEKAFERTPLLTTWADTTTHTAVRAEREDRD